MSTAVRPVRHDDEARWMQLFAGYRAFYQLDDEPEVVDRVWSWVVDPAHELGGLVAEFGGTVVALANYRPFVRPSRGAIGTWLDDLYTDPEYREAGAATALIDDLKVRARSQGHIVVRWATAPDNAPARALYDKLANQTSWVLYDAGV